MARVRRALGPLACGALVVFVACNATGLAPGRAPREGARGVSSPLREGHTLRGSDTLRGGDTLRGRAIASATATPSAPELPLAVPSAPEPAPAEPAPAASAHGEPAPDLLPPLSALVAPGAPAPEPPPPEPPPHVGELWRFRSAAPLSGPPALDAAGRVFLASVEGFLHALAPDGAYRWSYGLAGIPIGAPAVDAAGNVFVATSAQRLYAFRPDGRLHWTQTVSVRVASPPVWAEPDGLYYVGRDRVLYGVAAWGSAPQAQRSIAGAGGALASLGEGTLAVEVEGPAVQLLRRASALARLELAAALEQPLMGGKAHWYALTRAGLAAHDVATRAEAWRVPARRAGVSAGERALVIEADAALVWLEPATGQALQRVPLLADTSAAPVVTDAGVALVPLMMGRLLVVEPDQGRQARVAIGPAAAWPPAWNEARRCAVAAAGGDVVGIDLSAWMAAEAAAPADPEPLEPGGAPREGAARHSRWGARLVQRWSLGGGA